MAFVRLTRTNSYNRETVANTMRRSSEDQWGSLVRTVKSRSACSREHKGMGALALSGQAVSQQCAVCFRSTSSAVALFRCVQCYERSGSQLHLECVTKSWTTRRFDDGHVYRCPLCNFEYTLRTRYHFNSYIGEDERWHVLQYHMPPREERMEILNTSQTADHAPDSDVHLSSSAAVTSTVSTTTTQTPHYLRWMCTRASGTILLFNLERGNNTVALRYNADGTRDAYDRSKSPAAWTTVV